MGLVGQFPSPKHDARHIRVERIDLAQCPAVERLRDHDMDEVEDLHGCIEARAAEPPCRRLAHAHVTFSDKMCQTRQLLRRRAALDYGASS